MSSQLAERSKLWMGEVLPEINLSGFRSRLQFGKFGLTEIFCPFCGAFSVAGTDDPTCDPAAPHPVPFRRLESCDPNEPCGHTEIEHEAFDRGVADGLAGLPSNPPYADWQLAEDYRCGWSVTGTNNE